MAQRAAGPLFRRIGAGGAIGAAALAGLALEGFGRLSAHALRVGFITEAYRNGVRDEEIMRHTRHKDRRAMRGYIDQASLVAESPAGRPGL